MGGLKLRFNAGPRAEIQYVCVSGQEIQRHFLKSAARLLVSLRGQHELVVLLSGMHTVSYLAMETACFKRGLP